VGDGWPEATANEGLSFGRILFAYLTTLVPDWRVSDEAWSLDDDSHLCGFGVQRNLGGELLVVPWSDTPDVTVPLAMMLTGEYVVDASSVVVVVDDREDEAWEIVARRLSPARVVPWSNRQKLAEFAIKADG
jgi:hypothetical protein